ncbi:hypothetical protein GQ600_19423 [Phytophthora cactorum]|nr:hypothetical protein GQ600_19423 [Phytophthora cactorum]
MSETRFVLPFFSVRRRRAKSYCRSSFFAGKRDGPVHQELMDNRNYPEGAILTAQKKAYCDEERMLEWINEVSFCIAEEPEELDDTVIEEEDGNNED